MLLVGSRVPSFLLPSTPPVVPHEAAQGLTGLTVLQARGQLGGTHKPPPSLLGTGDVQSPILEMEVKEKEAADSFIFLCKWRAGRQP